MENPTYLSLEEYTTMTKKMIVRLAPRFYTSLINEMLNDDEAITQVASAVMEADQRWSPDYRSKNNTVRSKYSYRNQCAVWAIQNYMEQKKKNNRHTISLSYPVKGTHDGDIILSGLIPDKRIDDPAKIVEKADDQEHTKKLVNKLLSSGILTEKQEKYIKSYYLEGHTFNEVGHINGVSRQAVEDSIKRGLTALRNLI